MKYLFYAIVYDVAGNTTPVGSSASPAKTITTNIQKVTGISINPSSAQTKNIGDTFKITATVSPSNANNKGITWGSSNTSVATVDSSGNVRCVSAGTATITATAADGSGKSASLSLTVRDPLTSLTLDKPQTTLLYGGATTTVTASTTPSDYDANNLTWTIGDTSLATISGSGKTRTITSNSTKKTGETTLTVSGGGKTATMKVSIVNFTTTTYSYTGSVQQVELPAGTYKLEVWGAQGASWNSAYDVGGKGGYSSGELNLTAKTQVYVQIGGVGTRSLSGGYNGGGNQYNVGSSSASGGGGSDIRIGEDSLFARIIVAGGGAGSGSCNREPGGYGGGIQGGDGAGCDNPKGYGATMITFGSNAGGNASSGSFGLGGTGYGNDGGRWRRRLVWWSVVVTEIQEVEAQVGFILN